MRVFKNKALLLVAILAWNIPFNALAGCEDRLVQKDVFNYTTGKNEYKSVYAHVCGVVTAQELEEERQGIIARAGHAKTEQERQQIIHEMKDNLNRTILNR